MTKSFTILYTTLPCRTVTTYKSPQPLQSTKHRPANPNINTSPSAAAHDPSASSSLKMRSHSALWEQTSSKVPETGSKSSAPDSNKSAIECAGGLDLEELEKRFTFLWPHHTISRPEVLSRHGILVQSGRFGLPLPRLQRNCKQLRFDPGTHLCSRSEVFEVSYIPFSTLGRSHKL